MEAQKYLDCSKSSGDLYSDLDNKYHDFRWMPEEYRMEKLGFVLIDGLWVEKDGEKDE